MFSTGARDRFKKIPPRSFQMYTKTVASTLAAAWQENKNQIENIISQSVAQEIFVQEHRIHFALRFEKHSFATYTSISRQPFEAIECA